MPKRTKKAPDGVIATRKSLVSGRESQLVRINGRVTCMCPYACAAACEPCDYADTHDRWGNEIPPRHDMSDIERMCGPTV